MSGVDDLRSKVPYAKGVRQTWGQAERDRRRRRRGGRTGGNSDKMKFQRGVAR